VLLEVCRRGTRCLASIIVKQIFLLLPALLLDVVLINKALALVSLLEILGYLSFLVLVHVFYICWRRIFVTHLTLEFDVFQFFFLFLSVSIHLEIIFGCCVERGREGRVLCVWARCVRIMERLGAIGACAGWRWRGSKSKSNSYSASL
jgi:hypothetical protein